MVTGFGVGNIVFAAYELLGFAGWGPGRLDLREMGVSAFQTAWPLWGGVGLFALALVWAILVPFAWKAIHKQFQSRMWLSVVAYALLTTIFMVGISYKTHFRLLGRHMMPLEPVVILGAAAAMTSLFQRWRNAQGGRVLTVGFCLLWLGSSLALRFAPQHCPDDYRSAATVATNALQAGKTVWWSADICTAEYYGVPLAGSPSVAGKVFVAVSPSKGDLSDLPLPNLVLLSKPDVYDSQGALGEFLSTNAYRKAMSFPAFSGWTKPASGRR
jgi:hypothetical protein